MKNSQKGFVLPLLLIIAALLLIGGGAYVYMQKKQVNLPVDGTAVFPQASSTEQTSNPIDQSSPPDFDPTGGNSSQDDSAITVGESTFEATSSDGIIEMGYGVGYNAENQLFFVSSSGNRIIVATDTAMKISAAERPVWKGEDITTGLLVVNPLSSNQIILSTHEYTSDAVQNSYSMVNRIYSYDLDTGELKLLATIEDKAHADRELVIIGSQSSKIIFFSHTNGTGGPCENKWSQDADRYIYLDLNDINAGLQTYVVPADKVQEGKISDEECQQDIHSGVGP